MNHRWLRYENGRFEGELNGVRHLGLAEILRWHFWHRNPQASQKKAETFTLPVVEQHEKLHAEGDYICWLGHASFLIRLGGRKLLLDPVFGNIMMVKRQSPLPYAPEAIGKVDFLLLSHSHYDHLDTASIKAIKEIGAAVVPLHLGSYIPKREGMAVYELEWYETYHEGLFITLVPARHWGRRNPFDMNRALWGGFVISDGTKSIYFAGDTSYGPHFKEIGEKFDLDYALLPVGAYMPEFIMKHNHMNPDEAYRAFKDLGAKKMIPMHYGTYDLSDEPLGEPLERVEKLAEQDERIRILKSGEVMTI